MTRTMAEHLTPAEHEAERREFASQWHARCGRCGHETTTDYDATGDECEECGEGVMCG